MNSRRLGQLLLQMLMRKQYFGITMSYCWAISHFVPHPLAHARPWRHLYNHDHNESLVHATNARRCVLRMDYHVPLRGLSTNMWELVNLWRKPISLVQTPSKPLQNSWVHPFVHKSVCTPYKKLWSLRSCPFLDTISNKRIELISFVSISQRMRVWIVFATIVSERLTHNPRLDPTTNCPIVNFSFTCENFPCFHF